MNKYLHTIEKIIVKKAPLIFTVIGVTGGVGSAVMAVKATPRAIQLLEDAEREKGSELSIFEKVDSVIPAYAPAVCLGIVSVGAIMYGCVLNKKQQTSLASACYLVSSQFKDYQNKVTELYGEDAQKKICKELSLDKALDIKEPADGKKIWYDHFSERFFEKTEAEVLRAEYNINRTFAECGEAFYNEFYNELGIPETEAGGVFGWDIEAGLNWYGSEWIDFVHDEVETEDGKKYTVIRTSWQENLPEIADGLYPCEE